MKKYLFLLLIALSIHSCLTEVEINDEFPEQITLNGMVLEDTFSKFTVQRFNKTNAPVFVTDAQIWITDKNGNRVDCEGSWITKDYTSNKHKLFGSSTYWVHCKVDGLDEMVAEINMPEKKLIVSQYELTEDFEIRNNGDTIFQGWLELKLNKKPELRNGFNVFQSNRTLYLVNDTSNPVDCQYYASNLAFADCYFNEGLNEITFKSPNQFKSFKRVKLSLMEYNAETSVMKKKLEQKEDNEMNLGVLNHFISPVLLPENVDGAAGFIGGAITSNYLFN